MSEQTGPAPFGASMQWALGWLFILSGLYIVNAFLALVGLHVYPFTLPLVVIVSLMGLSVLTKREGRPFAKRRLVLIAVAFLAVVVLFGYLVGAVWDSSHWGRGFYTEAVLRLAEGWNPIYDDASKVSELVLRSGKSFWYLDASLYAFLGHFEMAKSHTLLFAVPAFLLARHCFARFTSERKRIATGAALLSLASPVAFSQVFSFYADAALAYAVQCFLFLALLTLDEGYLHSDVLTVLATLWLFILNAPAGGLRTALVLAFSFLIIVALLYKRSALRWFALRGGLMLFAGFVILGFNPFMQNLVDTGSLLGKVDAAAGAMPTVLEGKTGLGRFLYSMIASPDTASLGSNIIVQQFTALFHSAYAQPDVILRGFGFIGGGLIVLSVLLVLASGLAPQRVVADDNAIYFDENAEEEEAEDAEDGYLGRRITLLWLLLPTLAIALFSPTLWWARSVAVLWFVVPLAVMALSSRRSDGRSGTARLLLMLAVLNVGLVALSALPAAKVQSNALEGYWQRMTNATDLPSDEDARLNNDLVVNYPVWNNLKKHGESEQAKRALWTKIEGLIH